MTVEPQRLPVAPVEEVDGELADRPAAGGALAQPTVQAAAVAATSFVAGLATIAAWKGRHTRRARRRRRTRGVGPIVSSRSFLVDVHVLGQRR
ncbi:MAG: hypothetical protein WKF99_00100 [Solirubrobacteraceae bacterium]